MIVHMAKIQIVNMIGGFNKVLVSILLHVNQILHNGIIFQVNIILHKVN